MDDVDELKRRLNLLDIVQAYLPLRKTGASWKGNCPFHQEKTASFNVNVERQIFKCFGCGEAGDILDFVMKMEHLTFPEALQMLADRAGIILDKRKTPEQYSKEKDEKSRLFKINQLAASVYRKILHDHPKAEMARAYLLSRGLKQTTVDDFQLGYAPPTSRGSSSVFEQFLVQRGFTSTERNKAGSPERYSDRLMFPLTDVLGHPIGFTGRALNPNDQPKYLNTPETLLFKKSRVLYPLDRAKEAIKQTGRAVLVEGQMDVLLAHQLGTREAVATSGTALTVEHLEILGRYTSRILFAFDADAAGIEATRKAILLAYDLELEPLVVSLPTGFKDLGELALKNPAAWSLALDAAQPAFSWQVSIAQTTVPEPTSATGKKTIGKLALPILDRMRDPIEQAHWVQFLAHQLNLNERTISEALGRYRQLRQTKKHESQAGNREVNTQPKAIERLTAEEILVGLLVVHPEHMATVATLINEQDFTENTPARRLVKALAIWYTKTGSSDQTHLIDAVRREMSATDTKWLDSLIAEIEHLHDTNDPALVAQEIRAGFERLRDRRQETIKDDVARKIADAEGRGDRAEVQRLLKELQHMLK